MRALLQRLNTILMFTVGISILLIIYFNIKPASQKKESAQDTFKPPYELVTTDLDYSPLKHKDLKLVSEFPCHDQYSQVVDLDLREAYEFIKNRYKEHNVSKEYFSYENCFTIAYRSLGSSGSGLTIWYINEITGAPQDIHVFVDESFRGKSKVVVSQVLVHELEHVDQILRRERYQEHMACDYTEIEAYYEEVRFADFHLTEIERRDLLEAAQYTDSRAFKVYRHVDYMKETASRLCKEQGSTSGSCVDQTMLALLRKNIGTVFYVACRENEYD